MSQFLHQDCPEIVALVVSTDMLRGLTNCRIIIIITRRNRRFISRLRCLDKFV